jgi:3-hydroxyisobutyrate dehydrogenase-like beta-hydroxyacid dehydrogenase
MDFKVGFIGLGNMGKWMALNILKLGFALTIYDIRPDRMQDLVARGAITAKNISTLAKSTDCILLSLPDTEVVQSVIFGEAGLFDSLSPGSIVIDLSTIHYMSSIKFAENLLTRGVTFIDAPVSGMESRAKEAKLTIMIGGDHEQVDKVRPILSTIGNNLVYMGKSGNGQLAKLVNQLLFNISCAAMAEILPIAVKLGLDPDAICQVVTNGSGQTFANVTFLPHILKNEFNTGYPLIAAYKDMVNAVEISEKQKVPMPVFFAALQTYQMALAEGLGNEDKGAMIKVWEKLLGVKVRSQGV